MPDMVQLNVQIPYERAKRLRKWAEASGYTLHRYMQKLLMDLTSAEPRVYTHEHGSNADGNLEQLTETMVFEVPLRLGQRLHSAARQMRDPSGKPVSPSWLARHIILHLVYKRSDIMQRLANEVDRAYVDHVPFPARTKLRAGQVYYPMPIKATMAGRDAIYAAAKDRSLSATALVTKILDRALPAYPGDNA